MATTNTVATSASPRWMAQQEIQVVRQNVALQGGHPREESQLTGLLIAVVERKVDPTTAVNQAHKISEKIIPRFA